MTEPDALHGLVMDRIAELWRYRQWWRTNRWADWKDLWSETDRELRALLRLARQARRSTRVESRGDHFVGVGR